MVDFRPAFVLGLAAFDGGQTLLRSLCESEKKPFRKQRTKRSRFNENYVRCRRMKMSGERRKRYTGRIRKQEHDSNATWPIWPTSQSRISPPVGISPLGFAWGHDSGLTLARDKYQAIPGPSQLHRILEILGSC